MLGLGVLIAVIIKLFNK